MKIDVISVETQNTYKGSTVLPENINSEFVTNLVISVACATKKKDSYKKRPRSPKAYQLTSGR